MITNAVRRRRAHKFDKEIAEAAREAANAGVHPPHLDDDDDFAFGGRSVYTDGTHGAYGGAPLKHLDAYNMSELALTADPAQYGASTAVGGAGHAGVGAAALTRARSTTQPYNAFAGPPAPGYPPHPSPPGEPYYDAPPLPAGYGGYGAHPHAAGLLDAAGLGAAGAGAELARGPSQHSAGPHGAGEYGAPALSRNQSSGGQYAMESYGDPYGAASAAYGAYPPPPQPQAQPPQMPVQPQPQAPQRASVIPNPFSPTQAPRALRPVSGAEDAYGGYADAFAVGEGEGEGGESSGEEEYARGEHAAPRAPYAHDSRASMGDEEDYGYGGGHRVLKVRFSSVLGV